jgi:insertion element IS1 protein InsB
MVVRDACPACGSDRYKKNGHTRHGKQNHQCKACERQFVATAEARIIADEQRSLIEHLLRERISLRGICRAVGISLTWLLHFMAERCAACPDHLHVQLPVRLTAVVIRQLEAEADELWSFVGKRANKQWLWIAMDATTRQVIAFHVGDRSRESAKELWAKIPVEYRELATFYTDQYDAYKPRHNFLSAGGELTRPYPAYISSMSHQGCTAAEESPQGIRGEVFKSAGLHRSGKVGQTPHWHKQNYDAVCRCTGGCGEFWGTGSAGNGYGVVLRVSITECRRWVGERAWESAEGWEVERVPRMPVM